MTLKTETPSLLGRVESENTSTMTSVFGGATIKKKKKNGKHLRPQSETTGPTRT